MKEILKDNNLKVTKGRLEVLRLLDKSSTPLSVEEIYKNISRESCRSLTTAYRIVNQLEDAHIIRKALSQNSISYYELSINSHKHYIVCSICGKITPIDHCPIEPLENLVEKETGYKITGHIIELSGVCPDCSKKEEV
ncbi:Fur family transcriptional regulator [Peptoniphilus stercorisuis]|uniref:Fe2+ or Zn2+ uptake regulation protein n=1 Tax=Peptoniphilus stercorisuis TaxID=1436965 RepID=A0ABS4KB90_9FIRM|nr:Fur family transcriptional regulator [Peptoniphilus stercorisuis]MBP2025023.1 Fe2+ or Zn2+ uptake regulation protein [Peptoniphilus stercorisuis]